MLTATLRLIRKDTQHIRQVPDTSEEEEEHADTFGRFSSEVEHKLWDPGAEIKDSADVPEDLAPEVEVYISFSFASFLRLLVTAR